MTDIEELISNDYKNDLTLEQIKILIDTFPYDIKNNDDLLKYTSKIKKLYGFVLKKSDLIKIYNYLKLDDINLKNLIIKKKMKSDSGIISITVFTSGTPEYIDNDGKLIIGKISCKSNCYYCCNEKPSNENNYIQQPRSYLYNEPGVKRANLNNFDPIKQINSRIKSLINMGHDIDKLEILILGGTWNSYPELYQEQFIIKIYYAVNTYYDIIKRDINNLDYEIEQNETAIIRIIGLTLETRPDCINLEEIKKFRRFNCTRIQLGVQHTNNDILKIINRGHTIEDSYNAIKLLKNNCYKIDIHIMLNLPFTTPEIDEKMLEEVLYNPNLNVDQYKIYPCAVIPFTIIKKWFDEGKYKPYDDLTLYNLIKEFKKKIQNYKRLNRIIRDIPSTYISGGYSDKYVNMRQLLQDDMKLNNWSCNCIRCKEIKNNNDITNIRLNVDMYEASNGIEYFISIVSDKYLIGFLRLRIRIRIKDDDNNNNNILPILHNSSLIRELHVYSNLLKVNTINNNNSMQHKGYGTMLLKKAEELTLENNLHKIAVISGVGVRNFYRKFNYNLIDTYMIKELII